jgi:sugar phosphate isomerase/epimerase
VNYTEITEKSEDAWKRINDDILRILSENNLSCVQSHPHYYNPFDSSEKIDEDLEFFIRQSIISSGYIGAKYCVIHPRTSFTSSFLLSRSLEDNKSWLSPLVECAKKHNTKIAIENLIRDDWGLMDSYLDRYPAERLGVCYDCGHANINGNRMGEMEKRKSRLIATHLHDNDGTGDQHKPVFTGTVDFEALAKLLATSAYKQPLSFELSMRNTPFWDTTLEDKSALAQSENSRKAFLKSAYEGCLKLANMVDAAR